MKNVEKQCKNHQICRKMIKNVEKLKKPSKISKNIQKR